VAVGLDYRVNDEGVAEAQAQGWLAGSGWSVVDLLALWSGEPLGAVVVTEVERDGTLEGPNVEALAALLLQTALPLVASGGVGATQDLYRLAHLRAQGRRLAGAIVGKALVERRFSVEEGIAACAASV
jgi:phosphoribosylformimino-5-aminoimidazole carboxamide ribonucleotide (ProFAR) isomerase